MKTARLAWSITLYLFACAWLSAQTDSTGKKISDSGYVQSIDKITARAIHGNYHYQTAHGYIKMHIHGNHYRRRGLTYFGWCIEKGRWEIKNDTLFLIESWDREQPFARKDRDSIPFVQKLILIDGNLYYFGYKNGKVITRGKYVTVHEWRKTRRQRRDLRRRS